MVNLLIIVSIMVCVQSSTILVANSTKSPVQKDNMVRFGCYDCYSTDNKVCVDDNCYCKPNYYWDAYRSTCSYKRCNYDTDCYYSQDIMRHCSFGTCVCDSNYSEDWGNGRKCTYNGIGVWAWAWVFFFLPVVFGISVCICLRRRRLHLAHSHLVQCPPPHCEQPPPYAVHGHQQQQQVVTVYRY